MYNDKKYGGIQYKSFLCTEYDKLEQRYEEEVAEKKQYEEKNKKLIETLEKSFEAICNNCANCDKVDDVYKNFKL